MKAYDLRILPAAPSRGALSPIPGEDVVLRGGFWGDRQELNSTRFLPHCYAWIKRMGWVDAFREAAEGKPTVDRKGKSFTDADVYKYVEGLIWEAARTGDPDLEAQLLELETVIAAAQEPDGYLNTYFGHKGVDARYKDLSHGHELYCAGHLFQAAVARLRTHGEDLLTTTARRLADRVCEDFGPDGRQQICGHPEIEVGLMELYRATGEPRYLKQARLFINRRGHRTLEAHAIGFEYYQDDVPVREGGIFRGHVVRALYYAASVVDLAVETDDTNLLESIIRQWDATVARRTYLTGGMGSRHLGESFGNDWELPPDRAYTETCGAVAAIHLAWRLLLATGESRFADVIERLLYNMVATFWNVEADRFFYVNPLHQRQSGIAVADGEVPFRKDTLRAPWFWVSCCPTNVVRLMPTLSAYAATSSEEGVQVHQYFEGTIAAMGDTGPIARLAVRTRYPDDGEVEVEVLESSRSAWTLSLRIPDWASDGARVSIDGGQSLVAPGMARIRRIWKSGDVVRLSLPVVPRVVLPDPRVDSVRATAAIQRGPVVYCLEDVDLPDGLTVNEVAIDPAARLTDVEGPAGLDDGLVAVRASGRRVELPASVPWPYGSDRRSEVRGRLDLTLIPYHRWSNRGPSTMRVWIPVVRAE